MGCDNHVFNIVPLFSFLSSNFYRCWGHWCSYWWKECLWSCFCGMLSCYYIVNSASFFFFFSLQKDLLSQKLKTNSSALTIPSLPFNEIIAFLGSVDYKSKGPWFLFFGVLFGSIQSSAQPPSITKTGPSFSLFFHFKLLRYFPMQKLSPLLYVQLWIGQDSNYLFCLQEEHFKRYLV